MASISEILLAQGRHAAESKRARAGAWQPLMQHLANLPGQVMQDRAAERAATEAAFDRQQQRDVREQTLAKGEQELQAGTRMGELLATPGVIGDDGRFDVTAAQRFATEKGYTDILDDILPLARDHNDAVDKGLLTQEQINAARRRATAEDAALKQTATQQGVRQIIGARMGAGPLTDAGRSELQGMAYANGIAAPAFPEPEKFTYGQLENLTVNGRPSTPVRTRSDGAVVDLKGNIVRDAQSDAGQRSPIWVMKDGKFIDLAGVAPPGSQPPSSREQAFNDAPGPVAAPTDPESQDLMSQAGLTYNGFLALTGRMSQLPRDRETRNRASAEVQAWARERGMDVSTLGSQYKAYNDVLEKNIERYNRTLLAEGEINADVTNLLDHVKETGLGDVRAINAAKQWLKGELNDPNAAQYAFFLNQLVNDIALYNAASQGRATLQADLEDAKSVVQRGVSAGSLTGMQKAITQSVEKMGTVLEGAVNRSRKNVWDLFGVGDKYKPKGGANATPTAGKPMTVGGFTVTVD